jgi:Icc-related predicted phosphoesterase
MTANPAAEKAYYSNIPKCDILLSHSPPSGVTGTDSKWGDIGSQELRHWILKNQPKLVICGHIHNPASREETIGSTRVINVATQGIYVDL